MILPFVLGFPQKRINNFFSNHIDAFILICYGYEVGVFPLIDVWERSLPQVDEGIFKVLPKYKA